jgi:hypothetical protein
MKQSSGLRLGDPMTREVLIEYGDHGFVGVRSPDNLDISIAVFHSVADPV